MSKDVKIFAETIEDEAKQQIQKNGKQYYIRGFDYKNNA